MSSHGTSVVGRSSIVKREKTAGTLRIVGFFARWTWQLCGRTEKCPSRSQYIFSQFESETMGRLLVQVPLFTLNGCLTGVR